MKLKHGASLDGLHPQMYYALGVVRVVWLVWGRGEPVITCTTGGEHCQRSLHPNGRAVDIRTRDLSAEMAVAMAYRCKNLLAYLGFDVVLELDHLHIEYDPQPSERFTEETN
jgi:hypothetical protein